MELGADTANAVACSVGAVVAVLGAEVDVKMPLDFATRWVIIANFS